MLGAMVRFARQNAPFQPIWALPLADPAGSAATATITVTAPGVTGPGVFWALGRRFVVQINAAHDATQVASAVASAINAAGIEAVASSAAGVVTLTARHVGALGNGLELRLAEDEANVLTSANAAIVAFAGGSGAPDLATPLANLGDDAFDWIASPYADVNNLNAARDFLSDASGRWSPSRQLYGHYVTASVGTLSALVALGDSRNDRHVSIMGTQAMPTPPWSLVAALGGQMAAHLTDAPELSRPLQTLELVGVLAPVDRSKWWAQADRQALYVDGVSAYTVTVDGRVLIDRVVTTEQTNAHGAADATFRDVETLAQMMFVVRFLKAEITARFGRMALADANPGNLAEIATPRQIKAHLIHAYERLAREFGVTENPDIFAQFVVVERDPNNATRVNAYLPVDVVNQLRIFAANVTTYLQNIA
jgi:phage tail sheath gpL-like